MALSPFDEHPKYRPHKWRRVALSRQFDVVPTTVSPIPVCLERRQDEDQSSSGSSSASTSASSAASSSSLTSVTSTSSLVKSTRSTSTSAILSTRSSTNHTSSGTKTDTVAGATGTTVFQLPGRRLEVAPWGAISIYVALAAFALVTILACFRARAARASFRAARDAQLFSLAGGLGSSAALTAVALSNAKRERKAPPPPLQLKGVLAGGTMGTGEKDPGLVAPSIVRTGYTPDGAPKVSVDLPADGRWRFSVAGDMPVRPFAGFQPRGSVVIAEGDYDKWLGEQLPRPSIVGHLRRASGFGGGGPQPGSATHNPNSARRLSFWQRPTGSATSHARGRSQAAAQGGLPSGPRTQKRDQADNWDGEIPSNARSKAPSPTPDPVAEGASHGVSFATGSLASAQEQLRSPATAEPAVRDRQARVPKHRDGYDSQTPVDLAVGPFSPSAVEELAGSKSQPEDTRLGLHIDTSAAGIARSGSVVTRSGSIVTRSGTLRTPGLTRKNTGARSPIGGTMSSAGIRESSFFPLSPQH